MNTNIIIITSAERWWYHTFALWLFYEYTISIIVSILILIGNNNFLSCCFLALIIYQTVSPCQFNIKGSVKHVDRNRSKSGTQMCNTDRVVTHLTGSSVKYLLGSHYFIHRICFREVLQEIAFRLSKPSHCSQGPAASPSRWQPRPLPSLSLCEYWS